MTFNSEPVFPSAEVLREIMARQAADRWRFQLWWIERSLLVVASIVIGLIIWRLWRRYGVPPWLRRDLRQVAIIACGVLAGLLMWSLLR